VQGSAEHYLEKLYEEGKKHGVGKLMKEIWITDVEQSRTIL